MVDAGPYLGSASLRASTAVLPRAPQQGRDAVMTRGSTDTGAAARTQDGAPGILRIAAAGAIAVNVALPLLELWRAKEFVPAVLPYAAVAMIVTMPLHLRHVTFGLRSERPAAHAWTLAVMAAANLAAGILVGRIWALQFASLAASILIVVRGPAAFALAGAAALAPLLLARTSLGAWQKVFTEYGETFPGTYVALAICWRTVTLYVPVRLVAMIRQIEAARRALESRAVIQTRTRIQRDLRSGLELALQRIISDGELTSHLVVRNPVEASAALRALVADSRGALADARRIAAGYRAGSLRAELDSAAALLQAAGSACRIIVGPDVSLEAAHTQSSRAIRTAVGRALANDDHHGDCVIRVGLDGNGGLRVVVETRDETEATP